LNSTAVRPQREPKLLRVLVTKTFGRARLRLCVAGSLVLFSAFATAASIFDGFNKLGVPVPAAVAKSIANVETVRSSLPEDQLLRAQRAFENASSERTVSGAEILKAKELATRRLVLSPQSQLILLPTGSSTADPYYMIVAEEIEISGPAMITWAREDAVREPPRDRGKAPNGAPGRDEGVNGQPGMDGEVGTPGYRGASAPSLILVTRKLIGGGKLYIDLRGQHAGPGGKGQDGGDGGAGAQGRPAAQSLFDCKRGPGPGGSGGKGGKGGSGGPGGAGGDGGSFIVMANQPESITPQFVVLVGGGLGGEPGESGKPGNGGVKGREGRPDLPFCRAADRDGSPGHTPDPTAKSTSNGPPGADGRFWPVPVASDRLDKILSPFPSGDK
jgi:hypothetical protein